eukprot:1144286-Pelagomonas_calceolata.AAC.3
MRPQAVDQACDLIRAIDASWFDPYGTNFKSYNMCKEPYLGLEDRLFGNLHHARGFPCLCSTQSFTFTTTLAISR